MKAPETLDEAVDQLLSQMSESDKQAYRREDPDHPGSRFHFGGGMAMRNRWSLWDHDTPLSQWFLSHGIFHGDDRSAVIFKALYCRLTDTPFDIAKEAAFYEAFWAKSGGSESTVVITRQPNGRLKIDHS